MAVIDAKVGEIIVGSKVVSKPTRLGIVIDTLRAIAVHFCAFRLSHFAFHGNYLYGWSLPCPPRGVAQARECDQHVFQDISNA